MRPLRLVLILVVIAAGLGASALFISKAAHSLQIPRLIDTTPTSQSAKHRSQTHPGRSHRGPVARSVVAHRSSDRLAAQTRPEQHAGGLLHLSGLKLVLLAALEIAGGGLLTGVLLAALVLRRVRGRSRREYALYELHLSTHDEAKPQDLEDMVESIANVIHAFPADRVRNGQPFLALELICGAGHEGTGWSINLRCEPSAVRALDAAISAAYPDVRLGRRHAEAPLPRPGALRIPGYVMRFRKERSFVYPLLAADERLASPPLEQIARAQVGLGEPSVVRFQLTPTPSFFEELARRLYKRHENKLMRQERWGLPEGGLLSTLNRAEMSNAQQTQNRSLFWLEVLVAADTAQACKTVAAAVQSRRGENRLHRRWMIARQNLYRRRFPQALGPLLPSFRCLVSAAEAAHLLALPSARMKACPYAGTRCRASPHPQKLSRATNTTP
ncbi:MAG: hypothetical protein ACR2ND_14945 [Solirubrobacteraceae bacterium]